MALKTEAGVNARATVFTPEVSARHRVPDIVASVRLGKQTRGTRVMLRYLAGEAITRKEALAAMCASCMCWHADGMVDCENEACPLYPWMPYRGTRTAMPPLSVRLAATPEPMGRKPA